MTWMVVYDCQACGNHSARRSSEMPWNCDKCHTRVNVSSVRDIMLVKIRENTEVKAISNRSQMQSLVYAKEIQTADGMFVQEPVYQ